MVNDVTPVASFASTPPVHAAFEAFTAAHDVFCAFVAPLHVAELFPSVRLYKLLFLTK